MKKLLIVGAFIFAAVFCFGESAAVIENVTGTVELKARGSSTWRPAVAGDIIEKDTAISTGFRSTAFLKIGNSTLLVRPLTRLSLEELITMEQTETINIRLNTGRVRAEVTPPSGTTSNYTVKMPTTTASVRGTTFDIDTGSIHVLSGEVIYMSSIDSNARPVFVSAGEMSRVDSGTGNIITPMEIQNIERTGSGLTGQSETGNVSEGARLEFGSVNIVPGVKLKGED